MKFIKLDKIDAGKFIHRYNLEYEANDGTKKTYEMISRNPDMKDFIDLQNNKPDAVVLIMHNKDNSKLLVNREFRMATGKFVYNFPAGLIDPGETYDISARRELKEETGLELVTITDTLPLCYSSIGFSNETNITVIGIADGTITGSDSVLEEIEAKWYSKNELKELLKSEPFAPKCQAYCYLWANS